jgi:hypothetical protein
MEAIAAAALLAVALALVIRAAGGTALERRRMEHRAIALQEIAGVMERAAALPVADVSAETLNRIQLSQQIGDLLPHPQLTWTVAQDEATPDARHIRAELTWQDLRGTQPASMHLDYWAFMPPAATSLEEP